MNKLTSFTNTDLGTIRAYQNGKDIWFVAKDICSIITTVPVAKVIKKVDDPHKDQVALGLGGKYTNVINESGVWEILNRSQSDKTSAMKEWITKEVVPSFTAIVAPYDEPEDIPFEEIPVPPTAYKENPERNDEIILTVSHDQIMASSRDVAEKFGKENSKVSRSIKALEKDVANFGEMFILTTEKDSYGREQPCYLMNRDGFSLIVMGFTGSKALQWKLKYINAFNEMERRLKSGNPLSEEEKLKLQLFSKDPLEVAQAHTQLVGIATAPLKKEIHEQKEVIEEQQIQLLEQKPLVTFANHVTKTTDTVDMGEFAKIVAKEKINIGRNRLFTWLREQGYLMTNNTPYQRYINNGYFKVIEASKVTSYGKINVFPKTLVTGKGQIYLVEKLREEFGMIA